MYLEQAEDNSFESLQKLSNISSVEALSNYSLLQPLAHSLVSFGSIP